MFAVIRVSNGPVEVEDYRDWETKYWASQSITEFELIAVFHDLKTAVEFSKQNTLFWWSDDKKYATGQWCEIIRCEKVKDFERLSGRELIERYGINVYNLIGPTIATILPDETVIS